MGHLDIIECESAEAALLIGGRKHEPMHLEGREGDCEEKVPMAADKAYRAKAAAFSRPGNNVGECRP
jgi:hypothetical protein